MRIGDASAATDVEVRLSRAAAAVRSDIAKAAPAAVVKLPPEPVKPAPQVSVPRIEAVTRQIDSFLRSFNRSLQFRVDEVTGRTVVSVCDAETGEVIRQVPGDEALQIARRIEESLSAFLDETA